jgi:hypothetical protein
MRKRWDTTDFGYLIRFLFELLKSAMHDHERLCGYPADLTPIFALHAKRGI